MPQRKTVRHTFLSFGFNIMVDFSVWLLELDGLRVAPFDQHSNGNNVLRELGLNETSWSLLVTRIVTAQNKQYDGTIENICSTYDPTSFWFDSQEATSILQDAWKQYLSLCNQRKEHERKLSFALQSKVMIKSGNNLQSYQGQMSNLYIYQVAYPGLVEYLVPPNSIIMSFHNKQSDGIELYTAILRAVDKLRAN